MQAVQLWWSVESVVWRQCGMRGSVRGEHTKCMMCRCVSFVVAAESTGYARLLTPFCSQASLRNPSSSGWPRQRRWRLRSQVCTLARYMEQPRDICDEAGDGYAERTFFARRSILSSYYRLYIYAPIILAKDCCRNYALASMLPISLSRSHVL